MLTYPFTFVLSIVTIVACATASDPERDSFLFYIIACLGGMSLLKTTLVILVYIFAEAESVSDPPPAPPSHSPCSYCKTI